MSVRRAAALAALIFCGCEGLAQAPSSSSDRVLDSFRKCRAVTTAEARLDCFDKAATALETAVQAKDVTIVDRQEVRKARRSLFGFTLPKLSLFGGGDDKADEQERDAFTELNTTVVSARSIANNRVEIRVEEGDAVWVTTDPMPFPPQAGAKIRIRKGALGNYFISVAGERSVRGMRLR